MGVIGMNPESTADWGEHLEEAVQKFIVVVGADLPSVHYGDTPRRVLQSWIAMTHGVGVLPETALGTTFDNKLVEGKGFGVRQYDQMIHRPKIRVMSTCAHHFLPFFGRCHFAYIPDEKIVGISKIPRLVRVFARRLQVQEHLTQQIADSFFEILRPKGCAVHIAAYHMCEISRGVEEPMSPTITTALRGCFEDEKTKLEFLSAIDHSAPVFP